VRNFDSLLQVYLTCVHIFLFFLGESQTYSLSWSGITDKLAFNCQNFARVRLQLNFAFIIRSKMLSYQSSCTFSNLAAITSSSSLLLEYGH